MSTLYVNKILPDSGSNVVISGSLIVSQSLLVAEDITLSGSIKLGNANTDSVGFVADISSSMIPDADVTYNLGSTSKQWNELVVKSVTASGDIISSGTITAATASFDVLDFGEFANITASGNISASGHISASEFVGDGSGLTGITISSVTTLDLVNITASQGLLITGGTGSFYGGVSSSGTGSFTHISSSGTIEGFGTGSFGHLAVVGMVSGNISSSGTGSFQGGIDCIGDGTSWSPGTGSFGYVSCSEDVSASGDVYGAIGYFNTLSYTSTSGVTLKSTLTADDKPVIFTLATGETDIQANDVLGKIDFQAPDEATGTDAILVAAGIEAVSEGDFAADNNATKLSFKTAASETAAEKMSLSSTGLLTVSGRILTNDTTEATSTTDGSLQTDGGLSVAKSAVIGDDLDLLSDSAILSIGAGKDFTITHDGTTGATLAGTPITINSTGDLTLDSSTDVVIDAAGGNVEFKDAGTLQLTLDMDGTAGEQIIKLEVDGDELAFKQNDGVEVARVMDGANLPTAAGTSTSIASGNTGQGGFGFRKMVFLLGSGNDDNILTLTAKQSGGVILVTPTNAVSITLPTGIPGIHYKIVIMDKINKTFTIQTAGAGTDNNDNFFMHCIAISDGNNVTADVDGDKLTFTNALEGSTIDLLCLEGGANEKWLAEVKSTDTVAATVAD